MGPGLYWDGCHAGMGPGLYWDDVMLVWVQVCNWHNLLFDQLEQPFQYKPESIPA